MTDMQAILAAEMARLRGTYLERLPAELGELDALTGKLTGSGEDRLLLEELHHRLHKLAGSGGTFGLRKLGEQSRQLELLVKSCLNDGRNMSDGAMRSRFVQDVAALHATLSEPESVTRPELGAITGAPYDKTLNSLIWLVDDDTQLGQELQRLLNQFGYDVQLFSRLDEVEAAAGGESHPDVLIMDVLFMEEGANATEEMLIRPALRKLRCPTLFISTQGDFESRLRAVRCGAKGFLVKPLDVPKLVDQLEQMVAEGKKSPYRVLIVDDDETLSAHFRLVLMAAGMEVEVLNRPEKIIGRVASFQPELVLMDLHMPDYSGRELAAIIRQYEGWIGLPIIYLSAEADVDEQIRTMAGGADDFLTKPISDTRLVAAISVRAARARQLDDLMSKDSLTGLLKHSRIKEELENELARSQRNGTPLSAMMIDIDHFKKVNDSYGHAMGDRVIRAIAHLLKQRLRKSDIIGRYGGEEFAAILPECDLMTAQQIMNDIRERFSALRFHAAGVEFGCTLSAGLACTRQYPGSFGSELLMAADGALYHAKHGGRNQVCLSGVAG